MGLKDRRPIGKAGLELDSASGTRQDIAHRILLETDQMYNLTCPPSPVHYQHNSVKTVKINVLGAIHMLWSSQVCESDNFAGEHLGGVR